MSSKHVKQLMGLLINVFNVSKILNSTCSSYKAIVSLQKIWTAWFIWISFTISLWTFWKHEITKVV